MNRNAENGVHQRRSTIARRVRATEAVVFFNVLTSPALLETTESVLSEPRERLYLPTVALSMVGALAPETGLLLSEKALKQWLWRRRAVKLVDATGISMPDTPENQVVYTQSGTQPRGVVFPLARLVVVIYLATGAALDM